MHQLRVLFAVFFLLLVVGLNAQQYQQLSFTYENDNGNEKDASLEYIIVVSDTSGSHPVNFQGAGHNHVLNMGNGKIELRLIIRNFSFPSFITAKKWKVGIKSACISTTGVLIKNRTLFHEIFANDIAITIPFTVNDNGPGSVRVNFDVVRGNNTTIESWKCDDGQIDFKFVASGFPVDKDGDGVPDVPDNCPDKYNPKQTDKDRDGIGDVCDNCPDKYNPKQIDKDQDGIGDVCQDPCLKAIGRWKAVVKTDVNALCALMSRGLGNCPTISNQVRTKLTELDSKAWQKALTENTAAAYEQYLEWIKMCKQLGNFARAARKKLDEIKLLGQWQTLCKAGSEANLIAFFKKYGDWNGEVLRCLLTRFPSLGVKLKSSEDNQRFEISVGNTDQGPRYKDISLDHGMVIRDHRWLTEGILEIELENQGLFRLLIRDSLGRDTIFRLGYEFTVKQEVTDEQMILRIIGGKPPYLVTLFDEEDAPIRTLSFNETENIALDKQALSQEGLKGTFRLSVKHSPQKIDEVILPKVLVLETSGSAGLVSILGLVAIAMILGLIGWQFWKRRQLKQQKIINYG